MKLKYFFLFLLLIYTSGIQGQEISPYLVGTNLWYTNPSSTVWDLTKKCGVQTIRIGGAEYDRNMPGKQTILGWVKQIQAIGAEPIVQVSQYKSAAEAAALVAFLNVENKGNISPVKYWNIGNEPWLQAGRPSTSTFAAKVAGYFKPIAEAMKSADSTILLFGPDECDYFDYYNDLFGGKNDITGLIPGHTYYFCDGLSWHRYPQGNGDPATEGASDFYTRIKQAKAKVDQVNLKHNRTGKDALQWGIGEYNSKGGPEVHTWGNGQMFGAVLGWCMEYEATYATSWSIFESGGNRQGTDFSFIDGNMTPRASYRHMEFIAKYFKSNYIDGTSSSSDFIVFGAQNEEQTVVMIMHRSSGLFKEYTLHLNDTARTGASYILNVNGRKTEKYSDIITPRTTQVLIFRGDSIIKINYSSTDFEKGIAPTQSTVVSSTQIPLTPAGLDAMPVSHKEIALMWDDNSDDEAGFIIERETGGVFKPINIVSQNTTKYSDTGLLPETTYHYRIIAYNSLGKSDYSNTDSVVTNPIPALKAFNGPHFLPGKIEAEDFDINGEGLSYHDLSETNQGGKYRTTAVDVETSTDKDGGFNVAYIESGEWLTYLIESVTPGNYDIALRTASNADGTKKIDAYIDDVKIGSVTPSNTKGWQNWETNYIKNVEIKDSVTKLLKLKFSGADYNLNWIEFGSNISTSFQQIGLPNKIKSLFDGNNRYIIIFSDETINNAVVQIFNSSGKLYYRNDYSEFTSSKIETVGWSKGIYLISVSRGIENIMIKLRID